MCAIMSWGTHEYFMHPIFVLKNGCDIFPSVIVRKLPRQISDHNPLILSSGYCKPQKHLQFKFESSWLTNPEFISAVKRIWEKPCRAPTTLDRIQQKIKLIKQYF
jgi:hypothetical protein